MNLPFTANHNRNNAIDTLRLLAAFCVIILHLEYPSLPSNFVIGIRLLSRWAIPFFFIVSGYYFAAQNNDLKNTNTLKTVGRLIWIFLLWSIVYIPVILDQHDLKTVIQRFFDPTFIYFGNFLHLWFISSLVFGYIFIAFCNQFDLKFTLIFFSITFIMIALVSGAYPIVDTGAYLSFGLARHWLSVPFLYIGIYLYKKGFPSTGLSFLLVILGVTMQILEARFSYHQFGLPAYDHEFLIGTIPFAIGMAGIGLNNPNWLQWPVFRDWGRDHSLGIYLIHLLVIYITTKTVHIFLPGIIDTVLLQATLPFIILGLCVLSLDITHRRLPQVFNFLYGKPARAD